MEIFSWQKGCVLLYLFFNFWENINTLNKEQRNSNGILLESDITGWMQFVFFYWTYWVAFTIFSKKVVWQFCLLLKGYRRRGKFGVKDYLHCLVLWETALICDYVVSWKLVLILQVILTSPQPKILFMKMQRFYRNLYM